MILAVTAYIPIPGHPRSPTEYFGLLNRLYATGIPLLILEGELEQCWLYKYLGTQNKQFTCSIADNPEKNTPAYMIVQAQKTEWLAEAAEYCPSCFTPDVLVWIDAGIFHVPGVTAEIIRDFMCRAENEQAIALPGCWGRDYEYDDRYPMWRWCGGVMVVPRKYVGVFDAAMKDEYKRWIRKTGNLSWEVNTLCRVEQRYPELPLWQYRADHDETLFTHYQQTEFADGRRCPGLAAGNAGYHRLV